MSVDDFSVLNDGSYKYERTKPLPQEAELRKNYCFWCGSHGLDNFPNCMNCGYEIGSYPPEVKQLITEHSRKERIATIKTILNTCKYEGRELYISTTAVEMLLTDIELNNDSRKAITAINKNLAALSTPSEQPNRGKE